MNKFFMINYHYVKRESFFKRLKYLKFKLFKEQIDFLQKNTNLITLDELSNINKKIKSKKNFCLLTFDDGYSDHYDIVFEHLIKKKIKGNFFIPAKTHEKKELLLVNKIQIIISLYHEKEIYLLKYLQNELKKYNIEIDKIFNLWKKNTKRKNITNFDNQIVFFIKELLQNLVPLKIRKKIIQRVFNFELKLSEKSLSSKFYMSFKEIEEIKNAGMHIGGHGNKHEWMEFMSLQDQQNEVLCSKRFLQKIIKNQNDVKSFCYPYGSYNKDTIDILKKNNFNYGLTTIQNFFLKINNKNMFTLPRYDTLDLLKNKNILLNTNL